MVSMDIRRCFDHVSTCRVLAALQARQLPRWLVKGLARELCLLEARARISDAEWGPEFDFYKGGKTGGVDTPALLNELLQHHLSSLAEQWLAHRTGYVIGGGGDDREMKNTVLSLLCWVDNIVALRIRHHHTSDNVWRPDPPSAPRPGYALETHEPPDHVRCTHAQKTTAEQSQLVHWKVHRLPFELRCSTKVLGSWCDDCGASPGAPALYVGLSMPGSMSYGGGTSMTSGADSRLRRLLPPPPSLLLHVISALLPLVRDPE